MTVNGDAAAQSDDGELVATEFVDLSEVSLSLLLECDSAVFESSTLRLLEQLDRPRVNLGGTGPPGRVD